MRYVANSHGQDLSSHLIGVAVRAKEVALSVGIDETVKYDDQTSMLEKVISLAVKQALLHDIGKTMPSMQRYLKSKLSSKSAESQDIGAESERTVTKRDAWHGVYHQEASWAFVTSLIANDMRDVAHGVYWHHKAAVTIDGELLRKTSDEIRSQITDNENSELSEKEAFKEMSEYFKFTLTRAMKISAIKEIALELSQANESDFPVNAPVPEYIEQRKIGPLGRVDSVALQFLSLQILIEADRQISSISAIQLEDYILGESTDFGVKRSFISWGDAVVTSDRDLEQAGLAAKICKSTNITINAVDTGAGKSSITLHTKSQLKNGNKLVIMLPERMQVEAMYSSLMDDYERIFSVPPASMQASHSGQVQISTDGTDRILESDINIVVFDRVISSFYHRGRFSEYMEVLRSDVVIDEFHKFNQIRNMWPALSVFLGIRKWLKKVKTVLLSATPDIQLIELLADLRNGVSYTLFDRSNLSPVHAHSKGIITTVDSDGCEIRFLDGCLRTFNTIDECQEVFHRSSQSNDLIIHSRYTESDKKENAAAVLLNYGKANASLNKTDVYAAKALQASYNISRKNAIVPICLPFELVQELGRWARFGEIDADSFGTIILKHNERAAGIMYKDDVLGFKMLFKAYHEFIVDAVGDKRIANKRDIMKFMFDEFFASDLKFEDENKRYSTPKEIYSQYIKRYFKESLEDMKTSFPKKYTGIKLSRKTQARKLSNSLRGESGYVFAKVIDLCDAKTSLVTDSLLAKQTGELTGAVSINQDDFDAIRALGLSQKGLIDKAHGGDKIVRYQPWVIGSQDYPAPASHTDCTIDDKIRTLAKGSFRAKYGLYVKKVGLVLIKPAALEEFESTQNETKKEAS